MNTTTKKIKPYKFVSTAGIVTATSLTSTDVNVTGIITTLALTPRT